MVRITLAGSLACALLNLDFAPAPAPACTASTTKTVDHVVTFSCVQNKTKGAILRYTIRYLQYAYAYFCIHRVFLYTSCFKLKHEASCINVRKDVFPPSVDFYLGTLAFASTHARRTHAIVDVGLTYGATVATVAHADVRTDFVEAGRTVLAWK